MNAPVSLLAVDRPNGILCVWQASLHFVETCIKIDRSLTPYGTTPHKITS